MMACWKQSNFVDSLCSNEISAFYTCIEKTRVRPPVCPEVEISQHMILKGCLGDIFFLGKTNLPKKHFLDFKIQMTYCTYVIVMWLLQKEY